ncbi:MAG: 2-amino-4-hydroxy-6-hydroxymethyldihydropteridine diphosphokinase [Helicobacter sp.]|nr:2-amino-4-hydroxy-6-hydroxymethyldihydropteridine diphosphokinase [Helicobacter sp.]MCI7485571.1 2-amino-4-hydroxy-6-hydroxymethyldihydropteridine diphosphokinase [Helicobacter sp.]MDD7567427.1 2-amino-4-hydroxy-6-hydroxymethyldihydropteridine diphosphokinase [Helicobacter sp.]MDY5740344.1 2-amino-4-hydroxy-6-hydroxymethyldihydropteridine diphosphokinase [Helicobacter sp.]
MLNIYGETLMYVYASTLYPSFFIKRKRAKFSNKKNLIKTKNLVLLGIGGNKPKTPNVFSQLLKTLSRHPKIFNIISSPIFKNPAFGFTHQADFDNAVLLLRTDYSLLEVYRLAFYLERRFGRPRVREFQNAPRVLDVDIILFNKVILKRAYLRIPHKAWQNRQSVCIPMSFLGIL